MRRQTAIAVASVATELLAGKTVEEAKTMSGEELAAPLGALPPVRIHCAQLVEGALRNALSGDQGAQARVGGRESAQERRESYLAQEDIRQMLEITNQKRRRRGEPELTEAELRADVDRNT